MTKRVTQAHRVNQVVGVFTYTWSSLSCPLIIVLASALIALPLDLSAEQPSVDLDNEAEVDYARDIKDIKEVIQPAHLAIAGLKLGVTKVDEIEGKLGKSESFSHGEHHSLRRICYVSDREADSSKLILGVGEDDSILASIRLLSGEYQLKGGSKCMSSSFVSKEIATNSGLRLGIGKEQAKSLVGRVQPSNEKDDRVVYFYDFPRRLTDKQIDDLYGEHVKKGFAVRPKCVLIHEYSYIDLRFLNSSLTSLEIDVGTEVDDAC